MKLQLPAERMVIFKTIIACLESVWEIHCFFSQDHCYTALCKIPAQLHKLFAHHSDHAGSSIPTAFSIKSLFQGPDPWQLKRTSSSVQAELFSACLAWGLDPPQLMFFMCLSWTQTWKGSQLVGTQVNLHRGSGRSFQMCKCLLLPSWALGF